jgi:predicted N-formylglutamate amidohydrolase
LPAERGIFLTCEHGGNRVPAAYTDLFAGQEALLATHRGYDIGALSVARYLSRRLRVTLIPATVTRLLVDLNRSPWHPGVFSEYTRHLDSSTRQRILTRYYEPYRTAVQAQAAASIAARDQALHVSVHSFTPRFNGQARRCDIGLLYDPSRPGEIEFCRRWQRALRTAEPSLRVRRNYPYRGVADGLVTHLRKQFDAAVYVGVELEFSQDLAEKGGPSWQRLLEVLAATLPNQAR